MYDIFRHQLLTGNINNLSEIIIIKGLHDEEKITKILSPSEAKTLFIALRCVDTSKSKSARFLESMENNSLYTIQVYYKNGKIDVIYSTEIRLKFYRIIDTKASAGNSEYVLSSKSGKIFYLLESYYQ